jgi:sigma-B regulation protein RsbU (phosphoserine phosphatase)
MFPDAIMFSRRLALPPPEGAPARGLAGRAWAFLSRRWTGRVVLVSLITDLLERLGAPVSETLVVLARIVLFVFCVWGAWRLCRFLVRRVLWRIRSKLLLSYLFIAVVPLVLLSLLFLMAGVLFSGLVASNLVSSEIDRLAHVLQAVGRTALEDEPANAKALEARLAPARAVHSELAYALARKGKVVAAKGEVPTQLPAWWKGPGFAGLVREREGKDEHDLVRAVWTHGESTLLLQAPVDAELLSSLQTRMGIRLLTTGGQVETEGGGLVIDVDKDGVGRSRRDPSGVQKISGLLFAATPERTDWETGKKDLDALVFEFRPLDLVRRLSPGTLNMGDLFMKIIAGTGVVFLVVYVAALLVGLVLARSITLSVHNLSLGTQRIREGDFAHRIHVGTRDQLGELAESFNLMSRGIQDLLREQAEKQRLEEELRIARQIQMSLLPAQGSVKLPGIRMAALCLPAAEVGGDYYDLLPLSETCMGVLVADVSGKGTSAALYMAELKGLVLSLSRIYDSPAKLLSEANRILAANMDSRSFITMTYAVVDTGTQTMRYARAGHNPIIHLEADTGRTRVLTPSGLGLGIDRGERFEELLQEAEVALRPGDLFLFFTDGLSEAMNVRAELFGESRLREIVERSEALSSEELKERILEEIRSFVGDASQHDDMTMVILKVV